MEREQRERLEADETFARRYEKVRRLAEDTARRDGPTTIPAYLQARAAWEALCSGQGYHDRYDVDERFEPNADWADTWETAYVNTLRQMGDGKDNSK